MRIRRNAARVLGSASTLFPLSSPPIPAPAAPPAEAAVFSGPCELNCSPWDVDADPKIEEEDGRAEVTADEQQPAVAVAAASAAVTAETETSDKLKIKDDGRTEAIEEEAEEEVATVKKQQNVTAERKTCSKKGKGWECTRPAEQPHPFCHYHLTILRSYKSGRRPGKNNRAGAVPDSTAKRSPSSGVRKRTWKKEARASAAADPDSILYYGSFAPGRGKRRGGTSEVKIKEVETGSEGHQVPGLDVLVHDDDSVHAAEEPLTPKKARKEAGAKNVESDVVYCKKNDGKGWNCKRPAALPSYFCSHHLTQMKAYSSNQYQNSRDSVELKTAVASVDKTNSKKLQTTTATPAKLKGKKRKRKATASGSSSGSSYFYFSSSSLKDFYYYDKFVPWRNKLRGTRAEVQAQAEEVEAQVEEVDVEENNARAEKFVKGIIDINVPPSDDEDEDGGVTQRV